MQTIHNIVGLAAFGLVVGWVAPMAIGAVTTDTVVIQQNATLTGTVPQTSRNQTGTSFDGLGLTSIQRVVPVNQLAHGQPPTKP